VSSERELTSVVQSWLRDGADVLPDHILDDVIGRLPSTRQRLPLWRTWRKSLTTGTFKFAATAAAVLALALIGFGLFRSNLGPVATPTTLLPTPGPSASASPAVEPTTDASKYTSTTPAPSDTPSGSAPWIAFQLDGGAPGGSSIDSSLWAMRADGSHVQKIRDGLDSNVAWSHDGTRLLANTGQAVGRILVAEVGDEIGPLVETGFETAANGQWEAFDFAPDDERVVYVQKEKCARALTSSAPKFGFTLVGIVAETAGANCVVLSVLDLRTGTRTELGETLVKNQTPTENMDLELPAWSPDATKIAYTRHDMGSLGLEETRELWIVNADGTNPSKVELQVNVPVREPRWSPDGTRISFTSEVTLSDNAPVESTVYVVDLATGGLERASTGTDPAARNICCAAWIDNTRLRVQGNENRFWLGTLGGVPGESRLLLDLTDSLAAIDGAGQPTTRSAPGNPGRTYVWQPVAAVQP
jgi:hypothetical protein